MSYKKKLQIQIKDLLDNLTKDLENIQGIIDTILTEYEKSKKTKKFDKYLLDTLNENKNIFLYDIENIDIIKNNLLNYSKTKYGSGWFYKSTNKRTIYTAKKELFNDIDELLYIFNNIKLIPTYSDYYYYLEDLQLYSEYVKISLNNFIDIFMNKLNKYKIKKRNLDSMILSNIRNI
jgi:hypothetical protein